MVPASKLSIPEAQAALVLDPGSAFRWADLADAEINADNIPGAKYSFRRALAAGPGSPAILFRAATFYLRLEDYPETLAKLTAILRNPDLSEYYSRVFSLYRQMDMPLQQILNQGIPHNQGAATGFLSFWIEGNQMDEARDTWTWMVENSLADLDAAAEYVTFLVKKKLYTNADDVWAAFNGRNEPQFLKSNWIFNGGFESEPADCPFDWNISSNGDVTADIENGMNYGGAASLRVNSGSTRKSEFIPAWQDVVLSAGSWNLKGYLKTNRSSHEQELFFHIVDAEDSSRLDISTDRFQGNQEWTAIEKDFLVPPATRLIRIELIAPQSGSFSGDTAGSVWVDHIELTPRH
jgi:tetratricopeptide (TPR) repeat protein